MKGYFGFGSIALRSEERVKHADIGDKVVIIHRTSYKGLSLKVHLQTRIKSQRLLEQKLLSDYVVVLYTLFSNFNGDFFSRSLQLLYVYLIVSLLHILWVLFVSLNLVDLCRINWNGVRSKDSQLWGRGNPQQNQGLLAYYCWEGQIFICLFYSFLILIIQVFNFIYVAWFSWWSIDFISFYLLITLNYELPDQILFMGFFYRHLYLYLCMYFFDLN